jgi:two-component system sensor histidine kinase VicK
VRQILDNLVDNAYHYTPANGQIQVRIHSENGEVQVDVSDTGVGISLEDQERVFERFFRGEHPLVLSTPGTGLGLPIVKQLVEMHHGRIWMTSKGIPGEGSIFSFTLPAHQTVGRGKNGKNTDR